MKEHVITGIHPGSIAEELGIEIGDKLSGIRSLEESIVGEEEACLQEETFKSSIFRVLLLFFSSRLPQM